jgi:hypothetical protein
MIRTPVMALVLCLAAASTAWADESKDEKDQKDDKKSFLERFEEFRQAMPFDLHGGAYFWHYEPLIHDAKNHTEIYFIYLTFDVKFDDFAFHFEPRFRDTPLRPFFQSNTWVQEAYVSWKIPEVEGFHPGTLKAGKIYTQFGRMWDNVFYGNLPYFDGLKLDPDLGLSLENGYKVNDSTTINYSLQYFEEDGETNGSLQGRDTLSVAGAEQSSTFVARVAPTFKLSDDLTVTVGGSAMHMRADLPTNDDDVRRLNAEATVAYGPFEIFADYTHQRGHHVIDFPLPGVPSDENEYLMSGAAWQALPWLKPRVSYSISDYREDTKIKQSMLLAGADFALHKQLTLMLEYVYWRQEEPGSNETIDDSLNFVIYVNF